MAATAAQFLSRSPALPGPSECISTVPGAVALPGVPLPIRSLLRRRRRPLTLRAAVVSNPTTSSSGPAPVEAGRLSFRYCFTKAADGFLYWEGVRVQDVMDAVERRPFYLYSKAQITRNFEADRDALEGLRSVTGYAIKANNNVKILEHLRRLGCGAVLVSGNELRLALRAGFDPRQHIELVSRPSASAETSTFDVVGPVCESADFLGKDRELPTPEKGAGLVIHDAGAYCMSMASTYNLKM